MPAALVAFGLLLGTAPTALAVAVEGDFNGDGIGDLAIGVTGESVGAVPDAGAVNVLYGGPSLLTATGNQLWTQDSPGVLDTAEDGDRFGAELATGDFNGDAFEDLAVGIPNESTGPALEFTGAVQVIYGSAAGLTATGNQFFTQDTPNVPDAAEDRDLFGFALATGDLGRDGADDLAIGSPGEDFVGADEAGMVHVLYGNIATGRLTTSGIQGYWQDATAILDQSEPRDQFGWSLAVGNFGGGVPDDLAIGARGESIGSQTSAGAVHVLAGTTSGVTASGNQLWTQDSPGVLETAQLGDQFGYTLAAADFGKDRYDDLAITAEGEDTGSRFTAGAVHVLYGSPFGATATGNQLFSQDTAGVPDQAEDNDGFGFTLAAGNLGGASQADLAVGVPFEGLASPGALEGAVHVFYGTPTGLSTTGNQFWTQDSPDVREAAESGDRFGWSLGALNLGAGPEADLAIGANGENRFAMDDGLVHVLPGTATGVSAGPDQLWTQNAPGVLDVSESNDAFGNALGG